MVLQESLAIANQGYTASHKERDEWEAGGGGELLYSSKNDVFKVKIDGQSH